MSHDPAGGSAASQKGHQFHEVVNILVVDSFFFKRPETIIQPISTPPPL